MCVCVLCSFSKLISCNCRHSLHACVCVHVRRPSSVSHVDNRLQDPSLSLATLNSLHATFVALTTCTASPRHTWTHTLQKCARVGVCVLCLVCDPFSLAMSFIVADKQTNDVAATAAVIAPIQRAALPAMPWQYTQVTSLSRLQGNFFNVSHIYSV